MQYIGIIGVGVVGGAIYKSLKKKNEKGDMLINVYDKYKELGTFENVLGSKIIFLCLPTEYSHELCCYDKSGIHEICNKLQESNYKGIVVIKSTVEPSTCEELEKKYNLCIIHNPEFLNAKSAFEDFHNQKHIILGSTSKSNEKKTKKLFDFYKRYYPDAEISLCSSIESESVKLFCNNFYAVKVQFFNELYLLCKKLSIEYNTVLKMMLKNQWINPMHTKIPGNDNKLSYGGMCFPKDTNALCSFMEKLETPNDVLKAVIKERNSMRED